MQKLISALKGCRDALDAIPEGIRGVHDHKINRALHRADAALGTFGETTMSNLFTLRDILRAMTYTEMERISHILVSNILPRHSDVDYDDIPTDDIVKMSKALLLACDQIDLDQEDEDRVA